MGTTADKIAGKIRSQLRSKIIDLSGLRAAKDILEEAQLGADGVKNLISKGHDPCHAVYIFAQRFASVLGEQLSEMKETRQFVKIVGEAEDEYQPGGPPLSPLTISYFTMWSLFDVLFGQSHETIGTCILRIGELIEMPSWLLDVISLMQNSAMGIYVHCGSEGNLVRGCGRSVRKRRDFALCPAATWANRENCGSFACYLPRTLYLITMSSSTRPTFLWASPNECSRATSKERSNAWGQENSQEN